LSIVVLDELDKQVLSTLLSDGRISYTELGKKIGVPPSTVHDKVHRLVEEGVIKRYSIVIDERVIGYNLIAIVGVQTTAKAYKGVADALVVMPEVIEVYGTTAEFDLMVKVQATNRDELTRIINRVRAVDGIDDIYIFSILENFKNEPLRPIVTQVHQVAS